MTYSDFTQEERAACPPTIVVVDSYSDALRKLMSHERPLKVVMIDGAAGPGDDDATLAILAAQNAYAAQCSTGYADHLMRCVSEALSHDGPAMIRVYAPHPVRHGIQAAAVVEQARMAVQSRAVPLFTYDPSRGAEISERLDLTANPAPACDWITQSKGGDVFTYADWAAREGRFYEHFRVIPKKDWGPELIPLAEYIAGTDQGRPFVDVAGVGGAVVRKEVLKPILREMRRRAETWHLLQELAGVRSSLADRLRREAETAIAAAREQAQKDVTRMYEGIAAESQVERTRMTHQMLTARLMQLSGIHKGEDA